MTENPMLAIGDRLRKAGRGSSDHIVLYSGVELFFIYYSDKFYHFRQHFLIEKDIQVHIRPAHRRVYERVPDSQSRRAAAQDGRQHCGHCPQAGI